MRLGAQAVEVARGHAHARDLRRGRRPRAPPPPLRGEQPLPADARRARPRRLGHVPGGPARRDRRAARPSVVRREPVPPGVQVAPDAPGAALPRVRRRRAGASRERSRRRAASPRRRRGRRLLDRTIWYRTRMAERSETLELFLELCAIPSPPGEERAVADRVTAYLRELGLDVDEDDAGARDRLERRATCSAGCPAARTAARRSSSAPTSTPSRRRGRSSPSSTDGIVRNAGGTILGADNKAAVAAMLEAARRDRRGAAAARRHRAALHAEGGGRPASAPAPSTTRGSRRELGYVYDQAAPIGEIILGAPVRPHDLGALPRPRRALGHGTRRRAARRSRRRPARSPTSGSAGSTSETTANVGLITGGTRAQHRPGVVHARGGGALARRAASSPTSSRRCSTRSRFAASLGDCTRRDGGQRDLPRLSLPARTSRSCELAAARARALRLRGPTALTGGGADANVFNAARAAVREPRERDGRDPHAGRAHRRRRPRRRWST